MRSAGTYYVYILASRRMERCTSAHRVRTRLEHIVPSRLPFVKQYDVFASCMSRSSPPQEADRAEKH